MISGRIVQAVLIAIVVLSAIGIYSFGRSDLSGGAGFIGVCVKAENGYSLLFNSTYTLLVPERLEVGEVYLVRGNIKPDRKGLRISGNYEIQTMTILPNWLTNLKGAYWERKGRYYLLTPEWIELGKPLPIQRGSIVKISGVRYGSKFYPVRVSMISTPLRTPEDGMPVIIEGTVVGYFREKNRVILWNGSERIYVYLPYGQSLKIGLRVRILGRVSLTSRVNIYVDHRDDVKTIDYHKPVPIGKSSVGELVKGTCQVVKVQKSGLVLNCTDLKLKGIHARTGDTLRIEAVNSGSKLVCLNCEIIRKRENLPNRICEFKEGRFSRIQGIVAWVRRYGNGFALANVTYGQCWVLLKLPKSLGVHAEAGEEITAYGFFTTYRGKPAFEVGSGDDLCSGTC